MKFVLCALTLLSADTLLAADEILKEEVTFPAEKVESKSYLALPKGPGPFPGVLVLHEWWGLNESMKTRADMLAGLGYAALAVDMFGDGRIAHDPPQAGFLVAQLTGRPAVMQERFTAAMHFLRRRPEVDGEKIAALGYGTGGDICLQMARNGAVGLDAVVAFHPFFKVHDPNPPIDKPPAKILVCNAGEDPYVPLSTIADFKDKMKACKANMQFVDFPEAMQSFTIPNASKIGEKFNIPHVYRAEDDVASWKLTREFLADLWAEKPADE